MKRILAESEHYIVEHEWERPVIVHRATGVRSALREHHGDPSCAVIAPDESWMAVGGEGLSIIDARGVEHALFLEGPLTFLDSETGSQMSLTITEPCWFIAAMRVESGDSLRVLFDPHAEYASTWIVDARTLAATRIHTDSGRT